MFDIENSLGYLLAQNHFRAAALFAKALQPHDITPPQFGVLAYLAKEDGLTLLELAHRNRTDQPTLSAIIDHLEKLNLVAPREDQQESGSRRFFLTDSGREMETVLSNLALVNSNFVSSSLSEPERAELIRLLRKMRESA